MRGWKYLTFFVIGILSFFAGFYLGDEMHLGYLKLSAPGDYLNLTEEELEKYPSLKEAIELANKSENGRTYLKVHPDEWGRIGNFLSEKGSHNIKIGEECYVVGFICA